MYLKIFGLKEKPFHITPNPRFIFLSKNHKEAFAHLLYGVRQRVGFLSLIGEVGTGKTTVLRTLLRQLEQANFKVALIFNPCLSALELLQAVHREFGIPCKGNENNLASLHDSLNQFLLEQRQKAKTVVLVIDEAQNLEPVVLEQLRLLSNLETETDKLLQLIIVGQPELEEVLGRHELRQLKQRLTVRYQLKNMDAEDTAAYVLHRLKVAGFSEKKLFTEKALQQVYRLTHGLPRLINILCDRALLVAYSRELDRIDQKVIREAQSELAGQAPRTPVRWLRYVLAFIVVAAVGLVFSMNPEIISDLLANKSQKVSTPVKIVVQEEAPAEPISFEIDPQFLTRLKLKIGTLGEVDSGKISASAVLKSWGQQPLSKFKRSQYRPMEATMRTRSMGVIRFQGSRDQLLELDAPAILSVVLPTLQGKRYLALLGYRDGQVLTAPKLVEGGWFPLEYLDEIWFGRAVIPWNNFEQLPYLDSPGQKVRGVKRTQKLIRLAGYPELSITGTYDLQTIKAVSNLQKRAGLAPDGRVGAQTLMQLYRMVGQKMPQLHDGVTL